LLTSIAQSPGRPAEVEHQYEMTDETGCCGCKFATYKEEKGCPAGRGEGMFGLYVWLEKYSCLVAGG
jgi:hypothetical protein